MSANPSMASAKPKLSQSTLAGFVTRLPVKDVTNVANGAVLKPQVASKDLVVATSPPPPPATKKKTPPPKKMPVATAKPKPKPKPKPNVKTKLKAVPKTAIKAAPKAPSKAVPVQAPAPTAIRESVVSAVSSISDSEADSSEDSDLTETDSSDESSSDSDDDSDKGDWWVTDSVIDNLLDSVEDDSDTGEDTPGDASKENSPEPVPLSEKQIIAYRSRLKKTDPQKWLDDMVKEKGLSKLQVLRVMGINMPDFLEHLPEGALNLLLEKAMKREMKKRRKLKHVNTIDDVCKAIERSKNILVITGAGISTSLGIPDFRSPQNGLYSRLKHLGLDDPQDVFDIDTFRDDPTIFYSVAKDIIPDTKRFTPTHAFIELLQRKGKLLTNYTQNIDNIEAYAGVTPDKLIQCHGSFATATCQKCSYKVPGEEIFPEMRQGNIPRCPECQKQTLKESKSGKKRKRGRNSDGPRKQKYSEDASADEEEHSFYTAGIMKPDITFFGERLPEHFYDRLFDEDIKKADMLLCIGTSLKVAPVCKIPNHLPRNVPQVMISKTDIDENFDVKLMGSCDDVVTELARRCGWEFEHEMITKDWKVDIKPVAAAANFVVDDGDEEEDPGPCYIWEFERTSDDK